MLEPDSRTLLLDLLRPPVGYTLDAAFGTTYSLNISALMTAPLAFAMFDRQDIDGGTRQDPIAVLQALRHHASTITIFCQAGQIGVPPEYRSLLVYLEDSVYPVVPRLPDSIFHPKIWFLRFRQVDTGAASLRLLCLSRNLTFDRSWDTALRLDGTATADVRYPELAEFAVALTELTTRTKPMPTERIATVQDLGSEFSRAQWLLPPGFENVRFWPLGHDDVERWPFGERLGRTFVISPFVTAGALRRLTRHRESILLSRGETFDALGNKVTNHLRERFVLNPAARAPDDVAANQDVEEAVAEASSEILEGLHAKAYIVDAGRRSRVWTGSANCTEAAFHGNVEFLVELEGRRDRCGVDRVLGDPGDRMSLRSLLDQYLALQAEPAAPTHEEQVDALLDRARRAIGGLSYVALCSNSGEGLWVIELTATAQAGLIDQALLDAVSVAVRPVTVGEGMVSAVLLADSGFRVDFRVSEEAVTSFFAVTASFDDHAVSFLVNAQLVNAPHHRVERVLADALRNRHDLIRFLLLLLGNTEEALALFDGRGKQGDVSVTWISAFGSDALLEPIVRAFSRNPERIREIQLVVEQLTKDRVGESVLPERWDEIWKPIWAALPGGDIS